MNNRMPELEAEIARLNEELDKAKENGRELEKSRRALLFVMGDLEEAMQLIGRGKKEWETTFDAISDPIFTHDNKFRIIRANMAYAEAAGIKFKEFIGRPYYEVFPKMDGPFKMCLNEMEALGKEEEEVLLPSAKILKMYFYPIIDESGKYLYSAHIIKDITEAKRAEERIKEEMDVTSHLLMISEATAHTTDIDRLMEQVVSCASKITGCDICLSYLWDTETRVFRSSQAVGLSHELIPLFKAELLDMKVGVIKEAMKKGPVVKEIGAVQELPLQCITDIHTLAVIPLLSRKAPLGLIVGIYQAGAGLKPGPTIGERDEKIMQGIMHQVSTALEDSRLYKESMDRAMELSRKIETIQVMHEIDKSILSTLKADEILETVTRLISKVISCERVTVSLVDTEQGGFIYKAGFGTAVVPKGAFVPFADTSAKVLIETGRTECVNNLSEMTPLLPIEKRFLDEGFLSHIRVPITIKGDVAGILTVGAKRVAAFTKENLSTLEYLCSQIGVAFSNARLITDLEELFIGVVKSLSSAIDAKSTWTAGHSERVTKYALDIAKQMGLPEKELKNLELAGFLHDIGKIGTYESILDKPSRLTDEELAIMRRHPVKGAEILGPIKQLKDIIPVVKYHHEYFDGTGYPDGRKGEEIPFLARILAVADTYDAMSADRPYRKGRSVEFMISEFRRCSGTQFDPKAVEVFLKTLQKQPS